MQLDSMFFSVGGGIVSIDGSIMSKTTLPANTLLIEIAEGAEAQAWVESNYGTGTFSYEMKDPTHYYITDTSTIWTDMFSNSSHTGSSTYLLNVLDSGDLSNVTSMKDMFYSCNSLTNVSLNNTSNVTDMSYMFAGCSSLTTTPKLDTSNVSKITGMFSSCSSLTNVSLNNTSNVKDMSTMFWHCTSLVSVSLGNTSNVTDMNNMFAGCSSLLSVSLDTSAVENMGGMFVDCTSLTEAPVFNTINVTNMGGMFWGCSSLTYVPPFDTHNVTSTARMFFNCTVLQSVPTFNTSNVIDMSQMFCNCTALQNIPALNVANVTKMFRMVAGCVNVTTGAVVLYQQASSSGKVTSYSGCFENCGTNTTQGTLERSCIPVEWSGTLSAKTVVINISDDDLARNWVETSSNFSTYAKVSNTIYKVTNSDDEWDSMFTIIDSESHQILDNPYLLNVISIWTVDSISGYTSMFRKCINLTNVPKFTVKGSLESIFLDCHSLTKLPVFTYSSEISNLSSAFENCYKVETGILDNYTAIENAHISMSYIGRNCFTHCGVDEAGNYASETSRSDRAQIPTDYGGDMTT